MIRLRKGFEKVEYSSFDWDVMILCDYAQISCGKIRCERTPFLFSPANCSRISCFPVRSSSLSDSR